MSLNTAMKLGEASLVNELRKYQAAFNDPNGKGTATEELIEKHLLKPYLPPAFECGKGNVIEGASGKESKAIDRVIFSRRVSGPLVHSENHSIFPIECVAGAIEITMRLTPSKLQTDVAHTGSVREMRLRRFQAPVPGHRLKTFAFGMKHMGSRAYCIGLPGDKKWKIQDIADCFRDAQEAANTLVHGLYVLGIGFFETMPEADNGKPRLQVYRGVDRLFQFGRSLRESFDRWPELGPNVSADLRGYTKGKPKLLATRWSKVPS